jgi:DNA-binding transcriptional LysR family regulator
MLVTLIIDDGDQGLEALKASTCDIAVLREHHTPLACDSKRLKPEVYEMFIPKHWSNLPWQDVLLKQRFIDFDHRDHLTLDWLSNNALHSATRDSRHYANNSDVMLTLVASGLGYALLTKEFVASSRYGAFVQTAKGAPNHIIKWAAAWYPRPHASALWKDVLKALK